jgi:hypothetical protein
MKRLLLVPLVVFLLSPTSLWAQQEQDFEVVCVGFYNLENLFDTVETENTEDREFTPFGENNWNTEKYKEKLSNLARVIGDIGTETTPDGPALLGVSEIENRKVLEDLVSQPEIRDRNYKIVHHHSPGDRGIDVSLLYQPKYFTVESSDNFTVSIEDKPDFTTRDVMLVSGKLLGERVHVLVDHWPSRYGGKDRTEPLRVAKAQLVRKVVDSLMEAEPESKIMIMGDLNDDPINVSVKEHLKTTGETDQAEDGVLFNPMYDLFQKGVGTLAWSDNWNVFDQIILSPTLLRDDYSSFTYYKAHVFNKDYLTRDRGNYEGYPKRTYVGSSYLGGYSDHFPVYVYLIRKK